MKAVPVKKSTLLTESTIVAYLKERKLLLPEENPSVNILTGGVSNVVFAVSGNGRDLVLKQALPELRVSANWGVDQRRVLVEARAIEVLHNVSPENVPKLMDVDPDRFTLVIERAPRSMTVWKEDLLLNTIHPEVGAELGRILGLWHRVSAGQSEILDEFREDSLFEQLRIDPFYRTIAAHHESISKRVYALITELEGDKSCLVHGDYSPKNILVDGQFGVIVLDFEVAHTGNPVFDLAFLLAHLLCKQELFLDYGAKSALGGVAEAFVHSYEESFGNKVPPSLCGHIAAIALARVDGKSPVNYLTSPARARLRDRALAILCRESWPTLAEVFSSA